ncbi:hypothetical protein SLA2020_499480 [Shorea laevis]
MAVRYKLEADLDIKAPAEKYYQFMKTTVYHFPNISDKIQQVDVHQGAWDTHGSIHVWTYSIGDKKNQTFKERVEHDDRNLAVIMTGLEGHVFNEFKSYKGTFKAIPKNDGTCTVKHIIEYEKLGEDSPDAHKYLDFIVGMSKDAEAHLVKN